jgi:hypothetical protein
MSTAGEVRTHNICTYQLIIPVYYTAAHGKDCIESIIPLAPVITVTKETYFPCCCVTTTTSCSTILGLSCQFLNVIYILEHIPIIIILQLIHSMWTP